MLTLSLAQPHQRSGKKYQLSREREKGGQSLGLESFCEKNRHRSTKVKEGAAEGEASEKAQKPLERGRGKDAADGDMGNLGGEVTGS